MLRAGLLVLVAASACTEDPITRATPATMSITSPVPTAEVSVELTARGVGTEEALPWPFRLAPDEGEFCVASWIAAFLVPAAENELPGVVMPADPEPGLSWEMPRAPGDDDPYFVPPIFRIDLAPFAWSGGTWEIIEWSPTRVEILLRGGESCEFGDHFAVQETCLPDEGTLVFDLRDHPEPIALRDEVYLGRSVRQVDPRTGQPLCDEITDRPDP